MLSGIFRDSKNQYICKMSISTSLIKMAAMRTLSEIQNGALKNL